MLQNLTPQNDNPTSTSDAPQNNGWHVIAFFAACILIGLTVGFTIKSAQATDQQVISGLATIVDGDTIDIDGTRIRLHGIDAPEVGQKCKDEIGKEWPCGKVAVRVLAQFAENKQVNCKVHKLGSYGRPIATCYEGKTNLNAAMIEKCMAWAFLKYSTDYWDLEHRTNTTRCGIWSGVNERPWKYRERRWQVAEQEAPNGCPIKGNISGAGQIYHAPWSPWYSKTSINLARGERWFCSEKDAVAAGWRAPKWR